MNDNLKEALRIVDETASRLQALDTCYVLAVEDDERGGNYFCAGASPFARLDMGISIIANALAEAPNPMARGLLLGGIIRTLTEFDYDSAAGRAEAFSTGDVDDMLRELFEGESE